MEFHFVPYHPVSQRIKKKIHEVQGEFEETYGAIKIDWDYFEQSSRAGHAYIALILDNQEIVGFSGFLINRNAHHELMEADNVVIFVDKNKRGITSLKLIKFANQKLKELGVHQVNYVLKDERIGKLLSRQGFKPEFTTWSYKYE